MKKEVLIAIIIGFTLGLIITIGVYTAQKSINQRDQLLSPQSESSDNNDLDNSHSLNITSPANYHISKSSPITITGITSPNAMIAATAIESESLTTSDFQGNFSIEVDVEAGENIIQVTSYDQSGNFTQQDLSIIYSTADLSINQTPDDVNDEE